jgi:uncharacterized protein (TIGR02596 family)
MVEIALSSKIVLRKQNGFSLVELLAVIAVMGVLTTLSITGMASLMLSNHLNEATAVVQGQLELARQTAKTLNRSVQLRFFKDQNNTATAPSIDSLQIVVPAENSATEVDQPVEKPSLLPPGVIIADSTTDLGLTDFQSTSSTFKSFNPQPPANYTDCYILTFSPTGAITTTNGTSTIYPTANANGSTVYWSLSLVSQGQYRALGSGATASQLKNYATFYLNSVNGTYSCVR